MSAFTPGPWVLGDDADAKPGIWDPRPTPTDARGTLVAREVYKPEDAHLIAAAPDLYEACREALVENGYEECLCCPRQRCHACRLGDTLRAALAKAEGK